MNLASPRKTSLSSAGIGLAALFGAAGLFWHNGIEYVVLAVFAAIIVYSAVQVTRNLGDLRKVFYLPLVFFVLGLLNLTCFHIALANPIYDRIAGLGLLILPLISALMMPPKLGQKIEKFRWLLFLPVPVFLAGLAIFLSDSQPSLPIASLSSDTGKIVAYLDQGGYFSAGSETISLVKEKPLLPGLVKSTFLHSIYAEYGFHIDRIKSSTISYDDGNGPEVLRLADFAKEPASKTR
ncbi:MAG: hypothetical protein KC777_02980 [Cyanobacteria bacterium HKST-UBA02]|nr:hypothetical protein [Cyanobacteria bacterium HKST-UBA02]